MTDFKKKQKKNLLATILLGAGSLFIVGLVIALVVADIKIYQRKQELTLQLKSLQEKVQDLKNQNDDLKEGTVRATDNAYVEKVAREELDLQLPGEKVFSFVAESEQSENEKAPQATGNWFQNAYVWVAGLFGR